MKILTHIILYGILAFPVGAHARFTQADTWMGVGQQPITLNKYAYANFDPANMTDPTGHFSLGSISAAQSANTILSLQAAYDIGSSIFNVTTSDEPLNAGQAAQNIAMAILFSSGGGKIAKMIAGKNKHKKAFKKRTLLRGVNISNVGYGDATRGFVGGSYLDFLKPSTYASDSATIHNTVSTIGSAFTSWTTKQRVAKHWATRDTRTPHTTSHGVIVKAKVRSFRIFRSPNLKSVAINGRAVSEGEWLVVGPVTGIPTPVR